MNIIQTRNMVTIPFQELSPEALQGVIEEFVTRDGTDYGEYEVALLLGSLEAQTITGKVVGVADGDTITVLQDRTQ